LKALDRQCEGRLSNAGSHERTRLRTVGVIASVRLANTDFKATVSVKAANAVLASSSQRDKPIFLRSLS